MAFGLQGTIVDQLSVDAQTAPPEIDQAVNGLAAFINGAGPSLLDGSGQLQNRALDVTGEAFSAGRGRLLQPGARRGRQPVRA